MKQMDQIHSSIDLRDSQKNANFHEIKKLTITMKKTIKTIVGLGFVLGLCFTFMSMADGDGGRIKVYLQNKCSSDVDIKVASPGSSTHYTVADGSKKPMTFVEGTKIYDSNGDLAHEVSSSSENKVIVVCD